MKDIEKEEQVLDVTNSDPYNDEKNLYLTNSNYTPSTASSKPTTSSPNSFYTKIMKYLNAETIGIEPIPEELKTDNSIMNASTMWFSANMDIASFALGALGPAIFDLNFGTSILTIVFFSALGAIPVAWFSLFGAELGMRQMVLSRYLTGNLAARLFSLFNCIGCVGWATVNTIAAAELINMVNRPHNCPPWASCLILIVATIIVTFFGYKIVHLYEKWSWVPNFAVFLVIIARLKINNDFEGGIWTHGTTTAGNVLSFGGSIFGYVAGWATYAADFTSYMPRNFNKSKIFAGVGFGLYLPICFTTILGAACTSCLKKNPVYQELYDNDGFGGLVYGILVVDSLHGFGQFCCVVLALSTISGNIPNMYSIALCTQAFWEPLTKIPRPLLTIAGNGITLGISIAAYYRFTTFMSNFMDAIGYFVGVYLGICVVEHFIFRRNKFSTYDVSIWNKFSELPIGLAGVFAIFTGGFGVAVGMDEGYWCGEIAAMIGEDGGDIGFELGFGFSFVIYLIFRPIEMKYIGR
ncbi:cytosine permease SCDLUD_004572 [Saccharomycodes ludwigii]|uniref:cytosine permease n=1 Tax=Saccharomycodes ludwigii TaxID=36035 RepID=UPI001E8BCBD4|nr:hypothetical protein SCDLUD_004572 [Saccharomycodes ludwigii]KAH3899145.1 hypothetical protein SCDLUD_004572 [Saccharomycodes ludwigii]